LQWSSSSKVFDSSGLRLLRSSTPVVFDPRRSSTPEGLRRQWSSRMSSVVVVPKRMPPRRPLPWRATPHPPNFPPPPHLLPAKSRPSTRQTQIAQAAVPAARCSSSSRAAESDVEALVEAVVEAAIPRAFECVIGHRRSHEQTPYYKCYCCDEWQPHCDIQDEEEFHGNLVHRCKWCHWVEEGPSEPESILAVGESFYNTIGIGLASRRLLALNRLIIEDGFSLQLL
jgi:hypothetical protein